MIMPRMSGLETFRRLLGMDRTARVVLCSGYSEGDNAQQAVREGALGLLSKPFTVTELLAWVDRAQGRTGPAGRS
jgi:DNA-binding NtrC family response regulator